MENERKNHVQIENGPMAHIVAKFQLNWTQSSRLDVTITDGLVGHALDFDLLLTTK